MNKLKYTKTATFIFPLLEIPRIFFQCNICYPNGGLKYSTRFLNAYLKDENIVHYNDNTHVFLLLRNYRDIEFNNFYNTLTSFPNYVDDYEKDEFLISVFSIPDSTKVDFELILDGKYSKISKESRKLILGNHFYHNKPITIPLILNKDNSLKMLWEEKLNASIGEQEVWSKILLEKETLNNTVLQEHIYQKSKDKIITGR
jgi:hypothetical protein